MNFTTTRFTLLRSAVTALALLANSFCFTFSNTAQLSAQTTVATLPANTSSSVILHTQATAISAPVTTSTSTSSSLTIHPNTPPQNLGTFDIVINPNATLSGNAAALAAFNRAAAQWEARISDPITVTIDAGLAPLGPSILGSAGSVILAGGYTGIRNAMVADAADEPSNGITAFLPTAAQFSGVLPSGRSFDGNVMATKANFKALGFPDLDMDFGVSDGNITFSTGFAFDFDNSDGVTPGTIDFETVAAHEIGHTLGFFSAVDDIVAGFNEISPSTLDLFRFATSGPQDPSTNSEFTTFPRNYVPGADTSTDDITNAYRMSTGLLNNPAFTTPDGNQASHWKDDALTGNYIGIMDPNLGFGEFHLPSEADFRAFDLMGYEVSAVPEPSTIAMIAVAGLGLIVRTRKNRANTGLKPLA